MHIRGIEGRERCAIRIEGEKKSEMKMKITVVTERIRNEQTHQIGKLKGNVNMEMWKGNNG